MDSYTLVKTLHILSSTVLFGTGLGIAFFMFSARTADTPGKLHAARFTVLADFVFTLPAVILQPLTGLWLAAHAGYDLMAFWLRTSMLLYLVAGACWVPVVWIQIRLKKMLSEAAANNAPLPPAYHKLFNAWFCLGWPAFLSLVAIFFLMVGKPV